MDTNATLILAGPYDDTQIEELKTRFEKLLNKPLRFDVHRDDSLFGGFVAHIDGRMYDGSLCTKLNTIQSGLSE